MLERLQSFRQSGRYLQLPASNRERLDALGPRLIDAAAATATPDATWQRGLDFSIRSAVAAPIWPCCSSIHRR
jgi:glutamate-ammonia-ligase adenylyltransferase